MKKSKIIIPAVAVLTLSVAAGITGTVAWFSATQSVTLNGSNVAVFNTEGTLSMALTNNTGAATAIATNAVTFGNFTHASYDTVVKKIYTLQDGASTTNKYYEKKITDVLTSSTTEGGNIYYAAKFEATFSITSSTTDKYELLFDATTAGSKISVKNSGSGLDVFNAFRVAMSVAGTSEKVLVWAPQFAGSITSAADSEKKGVDYVNGLTSTSIGTNYSDVAVKNKDSKFTTSTSKKVVEGDNTLLSKTLSGTTPVKVDFTCWFEGLDPACVSGSDDLSTQDAIQRTVTMGFYALNQTNMPD